MLLDLLRLLSLEQNMELYASLQIRQQRPNAAQNEPEQDDRFRGGSHGVDADFCFNQRQDNCNNGWQAPKSPRREHHSQTFKSQAHSDQSKNEVPHPDAPLDLTVKAPASGKKRRNLHKRTRPPPLNLELGLCAAKERRKKQQSYRIQKHKLVELISSSTSPSSSSTSPSSGEAPSHCYKDHKDLNNNLNHSNHSNHSSNHSNHNSNSSNHNTNSGTDDDGLNLTGDLISSSQPAAATTTDSTTPSSSASSKRQKLKGLKSHLCLQCGVSFSRSDMLTRHSRLHTGVKPYRCAKCKQEFSRSDHLSTHERTHTGEKPYQCQYCAYSACRRDMITRHMRTHQQGAQPSSLLNKDSSSAHPRILGRLSPEGGSLEAHYSSEDGDHEAKLDSTW